MSVEVQSMTVEELLRMPDDGFRYELIKGELIKMAPAGHEHGGIAINIAVPLGVYVKKHRLGRVFAAETGFILETGPDTVRAPDTAFVCRERLKEGRGVEGYWPGPPDLAVEVISPNDTYREVEEKVFEWLDTGCRAVIAINPRPRTATIYRSRSNIVQLTEKETLTCEEVVPGWSMPVKELFE